MRDGALFFFAGGGRERKGMPAGSSWWAGGSDAAPEGEGRGVGWADFRNDFSL